MARLEARLRLSRDLSLPARDFLVSAVGIIGKRGKGKSGLVKVLLEELVRARLPFVAFDPVGIMWGIKSSADGKSPGLPVLVVGGPHGDVKLNRHGGAQAARAIVQANVSCIVDFSEEPKSAYREFVRDFCHELYVVSSGEQVQPRIVVLEEAPELVPQKLWGPDMTETFEAVERLVSRGRNKGLGAVIVSQRAATISKDVLTQIDALFVFGLSSPQDRKALGEWVEAHGEKDKLREFDEHIAELKPRQAWFWAPESFGGAFRRITVREFRTFHPDKTHLMRTGMLAVRPATVDVAQIVAKLGAEMERIARGKDERSSLERVRRERDALAVQVEKLKQRTLQTVPTRADPRILADAERRGAERAAREFAKKESGARAAVKRALAALDAAAKALGGALSDVGTPADVLARANRPFYQPPPLPKPPAVVTVPERVAPLRPGPAPAADPGAEGEERSLRAGAIRMLRELVSRYPIGLSPSQVGTLAGFTPSGGTFKWYYSELRKRGLIEEDGTGLVRATQAGVDFVGGDVPPAPATHDEAMARWRKAMPREGAARMLDAIDGAYPGMISFADLGSATGFEPTGGTFKWYLSVLRKNGLVVVEGDQVRASESLYPGA